MDHVAPALLLGLAFTAALLALYCLRLDLNVILLHCWGGGVVFTPNRIGQIGESQGL